MINRNFKLITKTTIFVNSSNIEELAARLKKILNKHLKSIKIFFLNKILKLDQLNLILDLEKNFPEIFQKTFKLP